MTDNEIIEQFEQSRAPGGSFHHADHIRVAFAYLSRYPALEALQRFSSALQRFATAQGKPGLYHETITWAYVFLIHERMLRARRRWEELARPIRTFSAGSARPVAFWLAITSRRRCSLPPRKPRS
jgi:hypothetical protein